MVFVFFFINFLTLRLRQFVFYYYLNPRKSKQIVMKGGFVLVFLHPCLLTLLEEAYNIWHIKYQNLNIFQSPSSSSSAYVNLACKFI
jgi:hypothetical protein